MLPTVGVMDAQLEPLSPFRACSACVDAVLWYAAQVVPPIAARAPSAAASVTRLLVDMARPKESPPYTMSMKIGSIRANSKAAVPRSSLRLRRKRCTLVPLAQDLADTYRRLPSL